MNAIKRFRAWLQAKLGQRYYLLLRSIDGMITTFLVTFGGALLAGDVFNIQHALDLGLWKKAAVAGLASVLVGLKSIVMTWITGQTALTGLVSKQLRSDRDKPLIKHDIPLAPPAGPPPPEPAVAAAYEAGYQGGEHEAPE